MGITNIDDIPTPEGSSIMERLSDSEETESQAKGNADGAAPSEQQSRRVLTAVCLLYLWST
jgi:hypothetical protein